MTDKSRILGFDKKYVGKNADYLNQTLFKNRCAEGKDIVMTYDYLPAISLYVMEQVFYLFIFSLFLIEIIFLARYFYELKKILGTEVFLGEVAALLGVTLIFSVLSFFVIPIMVQRCAETAKGEWYRILLVRILNLFIVSFFYYQLYEAVKDIIVLTVKKYTNTASNILAHAKSDTFKKERDAILSQLLNFNYSKYICKDGKPIDGLEDIFSEDALKQISDSCQAGKLTSKQKSFFAKLFGF